MDQVTTRKILSNVQQVFKPSYNRVTWELTPVTGMAVDFTKSYFCFRMYLTHQIDGSRLTDVDYNDLLSKNLMIELGQNGFSYPAAALFKVARLYSRNNTGSPLEEILYQNVWACTMAQLTQDFETISSNTLSSGTAVSFNSNGSLASQISALMRSSITPTGQQLPVEIHVPLSDIFGICKNTHFDMSITGGIIIQIELEDVKNLFQTRAVGVPISMPPLLDICGNGIPAQPELCPFTFLPNGQGDTLMPSYQFAKQNYDVSGNALLIAPNGYHYELGTTLQQVEGKNCLWDLGDIFAPQAAIYLQGLWTAQQMTDAKFVIGNIVKLNFRLSYPGEKLRSKMIEMYDTITSVAPSQTLGQPTIGLAKTYQAPMGINSSLTTDVYLESIDVYESPHNNNADPPVEIRSNTFGAMIVGGVSSNLEEGITPIEDFYKYNTLSVAQVEFQELVDTGVVVVDGDGNWTGSGPFRLTLQPVLSGNFPQQPWIDEFTDPDIPTQRHIYTNQGKPLAVQGTDTQILSVTAEDSSGNRIVTFKDLGFQNNNSIQNATLRKDTVGYHAQILPPAGTYTYPGGNPSAYTLAWLVIISQSRNKNSLGLLHTDNYSFELDKCEIVLVEQTLDPSIPQTLTYETLRVEVATIETNIIDIYNRQFTVNEPSVFNVWLMTPQYSNSERLGLGAGTDPSGNHYWFEHPECLVSYARNTQQYRWAYNNIQNTNRDIEVQTNTSKYPSSLHLEKLMDTFSNTTTKLKNFSGIMTVPRTNCDPVVCFPLRIYEAIDDQNTYQREGGFTLQIALYGDSIHDRNIISGPIFLFKQMLKTIQG